MCTWLIRSTQWYFCWATASKPPIEPMPSNEGGSLPSVSTVVPGRGNSSWSSRVRPLRSRTGTSDRAKAPSACALAALVWESAAKASTSSRLKPSMVAIRSALIPCGTKLVA